MPYLMKAIEDGNNLDAVIQMSQLVELETGLEMLQVAERRGKPWIQLFLVPSSYVSHQQAVNSWKTPSAKTASTTEVTPLEISGWFSKLDPTCV